MNATLYLPHQSPRAVSVEGLTLPDPTTGLVRIPEPVPALMGCPRGLVDVLASGPQYVAYSVFDCEGKINQAAMVALAEASGVGFELDDEDTILCGPVLVVTSS
ncbi:hypothetical protein EJV47_23775 [Hymenobacter gummosus]|uniref:DUF3846 domain-containing protein n=1 Tax=Hymenobacter gummosus TaxID=1776032 RepID=A0A431TWS1_9BACT|nr:hypothetical protein [Hymenobacter gummosus]RTQ45852.1 hypothetical protein EJV47_23775 [Hymenobacter gummosus]